MPRLFIAIDLPAPCSDALAALRVDDMNARWTPPAQYHLTLRFIGDVDGGGVAGLEAALAQVEAPPLPLTIEGVGVLPSMRRPRVLYAGLVHQPALHALGEQVEQKVRQAGVDVDALPFRPHVTLARLKRSSARRVRAFVRAHRTLHLDAFLVTEFHLYESVLRPEGALHTRRRSFPLKAGAGK